MVDAGDNNSFICDKSWGAKADKKFNSSAIASKSNVTNASIRIQDTVFPL